MQVVTGKKPQSGLTDLDASDEAIDLLGAAQSEFPDDWNLSVNLGWSLAKRSQHEL